MFATLVSACILVRAGGPTAARPDGSTDSSRFETVIRKLDSLVRQGVTPSVAVAVARNGTVVWERGFGLADPIAGRAADPGTVYPVASVAKSLTALAVLRLADQGKLDLDRPAADYLEPGLLVVHQGDAGALTVRTLLRQTAGIPHLVRFHWRDQPEPIASEVELIRRYGFSAFPPGTHFHYSNHSFGILQHLIARVSGQSFDRVMANEVFDPLGMTHSAVWLDPKTAPFAAVPYHGSPPKPLPFDRLQPDGGAGFHSSAHDLALVGVALTHTASPTRPPFLRPLSLAAVRDFGGFPFYSHGWWRDPRDVGTLVLVADGAAAGHAATMKVVADSGLVVVALVNGTVPDGFTGLVCDDLIAAMLPDLGRRLTEAGSGMEPPDWLRPRPVRDDSTWVGRWSGELRLPTGAVPVRMDIAENGAATGRIGAGEPQTLEEPEVTDGLLEAGVAGAIPSANTFGAPHQLRLNLRIVPSGVAGYAVAASTGDRPRFMLPFYVELHRQ